MTSRLSLALAAALGLVLAGCNNDANTDGTAGPGDVDRPLDGTAADRAAMNDPAAGDALADAPMGNRAGADTSTLGAATDGPLSQAAALAAVMAVDEHEVAAAEQADDRDLDDAVDDFVDKLEDDHRRNLAATRALLDTTGGTPGADDPGLDRMREKHKAERERLAGLEDDADYQRAWLDAMVTGHTEALEMLDSQLIPAATDDPVREHLQKTRQAIARHLETAQGLRDQTAGANR